MHSRLNVWLSRLPTQPYHITRNCEPENEVNVLVFIRVQIAVITRTMTGLAVMRIANHPRQRLGWMQFYTKKKLEQRYLEHRNSRIFGPFCNLYGLQASDTGWRNGLPANYGYDFQIGLLPPRSVTFSFAPEKTNAVKA